MYYFHCLCCKFLICKDFALLGTRHFEITVPLSLSTLATPYIRSKSVFGCSHDFEEMALRLMIDNNLRQPYNAADTRSLYDTVLWLINTNLDINMSIWVYKWIANEISSASSFCFAWLFPVAVG